MDRLMREIVAAAYETGHVKALRQLLVRYEFAASASGAPAALGLDQAFDATIETVARIAMDRTNAWRDADARGQ